LKRQLHLPDSAAQRNVQVSQGLSVNSPVRISAMPALKVLHSVHQRALVDWGLSRNVGVSRKVADQPEQSREPWDAGIGIAGYNRLLYGRELLPIVSLSKLHVGLKSLNRTAVTGIRRLYLCQGAGNIAPVRNVVLEEFSQIVFLGLLIESEGKVLGIHLADVEFRDISHRANRKREIKFRSVRLRRLRGCRFEFCEPIVPPGTVIVVRGEPLLVGLE